MVSYSCEFLLSGHIYWDEILDLRVIWVSIMSMFIFPTKDWQVRTNSFINGTLRTLVEQKRLMEDTPASWCRPTYSKPLNDHNQVCFQWVVFQRVTIHYIYIYI